MTAGFGSGMKTGLLADKMMFLTCRKRRSHTKTAVLNRSISRNQGWIMVHSVHGIGRYIGVENVLVDGVHRDYLLLAYAGDDKLYVPVE